MTFPKWITSAAFLLCHRLFYCVTEDSWNVKDHNVKSVHKFVIWFAYGWLHAWEGRQLSAVPPHHTHTQKCIFFLPESLHCFISCLQFHHLRFLYFNKFLNNILKYLKILPEGLGLCYFSVSVDSSDSLRNTWPRLMGVLKRMGNEGREQVVISENETLLQGL